ncbi:hypothetical protein [Actinotalea sp. JY-7885]|uniref:hypothetical protein n=1 Tax=Actinotalea sp. JY-7885 TaxID=2758576 RepID=UPI00165D6148|nr:hypothetical protein [Actinotalea sp. JY-7885]
MSTDPLPMRRHDDDVVRPRPASLPDDELAARITRALRSRPVAGPDPAVVTARLEAQLAATAQGPSRRAAATRRVVVAGVVGSSIAVAGAGAAAAWDPYSGASRTVETVAQAVGLEWSPLPGDYTFEQHDAFWGAGYTSGDLKALVDLWGVESIETKARAGQLILDGEPVPVAAGTYPELEAPPRAPDAPAPTAPPAAGAPSGADDLAPAAFFDAGYGYEDALALGELWGTEIDETKATAARMLEAGEPLPFAPGEGDEVPAG